MMCLNLNSADYQPNRLLSCSPDKDVGNTPLCGMILFLTSGYGSTLTIKDS